MATVPEIRQMVARFESGELGWHAFQNWFSEVSMGDFQDRDAERLSNTIEGLLAESSHAEWTEDNVRSELASAVRSFAESNVAEEEPAHANRNLAVAREKPVSQTTRIPY